MHLQQSVNQRALNRYILLIAGIVALAATIAAVILAGPAPEERGVNANPFSSAPIEIILEASPALPGFGQSNDEMAVAQAGPRAELDTALTFAPQAPVAPVRSIELLGTEYWDVVSAGNVSQALALLPQAVQDQLGNPLLGAVRINVNFEGRTSSGFQPYGGPANFFSTNEGRNEVVLYPQQGTFTVIHELGHAYSLRRSAAGNYATVLIDPEMQSFMAIAGWQVLTPADQIAAMYDHSQVVVQYTGAPIWSSMSREDPLEDFANSFALYFLNPNDLASKSPERYAWLARVFGY